MAKKKTNSVAIASLVLGISAWFLAWIPFIGFLIIIAAIVTGIAALVQISKTKQKGKGMAIAGLVLGIVELFLIVLVTIAMFMMFSVRTGMVEQSPVEIDMIAYAEDWDRDGIEDGIEFTLYHPNENGTFTGTVNASIYRSVLDRSSYEYKKGELIKTYQLEIVECGGNFLGCEIKVSDKEFPEMFEGDEMAYLEVALRTPNIEYYAFVDDIYIE